MLDLITLSRESRLSPSLPFENLTTWQYQAKTGRRSVCVCCEVSLVNLRKVSLEERGRRKISLKATTLRRTIWVSVVLQSLVIAFRHPFFRVRGWVGGTREQVVMSLL